MSYERLTRRGDKSIYLNCNNCEYYMSNCDDWICNIEKKKRLADLEDKIEQGTLVELPCKVGDIVYYVSTNFISQNKRILALKIRSMELYENDIILHFDYEYLLSIKRVFFTREEAEAKLKEIQNG